MIIIPELNLNKYPKDVKNGSLVNAVNMQIAKDSFLLTNENSIVENIELQNELSDAIGIDAEKFNIVYAIPCNKEIIFFIQDKNNTNELILTRYNEDENSAIKGPTIDYSGGKFDGTFTYNQGELIISFSEYDGEINQPLRIINLKDFNNTPNIPKYIQSCVPEVKIPNIEHKYINGSAKKGWYYIFIRYKISNNNYTQWYYTNKSVFIDSYSNKNILDYYLNGSEGYADGSDESKDIALRTTISKNISDTTDIAKISATLYINNLDINYIGYQLGFVIVNKTTTESYKTNDIDSELLIYTINHKALSEYNTIDLITNYINYYNVKTLSSYNNTLYIANYIENSNYKNIINTINNIKLTINCELYDASRANETIITDKCRFKYWYSYFSFDTGNYRGERVVNGYYNSIYGYCVPCIINKIKGFHQESYITTNWVNLSENDTLTITNGVDEISGKAKELYFCPNYKFTNTSAWIYKNDIYDYRDNAIVITDVTNIRISVINGKAKDNNYELDVYNYIALDIQYDVDGTIVTNDPTITILNTCSFGKNEYYNFYIHFVDKYGNATDGFNIKYFDINYAEESLIDSTNSIYNYLLCLLLKTPNVDSTIYFNLETLPNGYVGYFVSYEKFESYIKYKGIIIKEDVSINDKDVIKFYSDAIDVNDNITLDFNKIKILKDNSERLITNKTLLVADSFDNINKPTNIRLNFISDDLEFTDIVNYNGTNSPKCLKCYLINTDIKNKLYVKDNKTLIPCSNICYETKVKVTPNTHFDSTVGAFINPNDTYYNDSKFAFYKDFKLFLHLSNQDVTVDAHKPYINPYYYITYEDQLAIPTESYKFNNTPKIVVFPVYGLNTTENTAKGFATGAITEIRDTIDLFSQPQVAEFELHPKTFTEYRNDKQYTTIFNKTIRRSNPIQDESYNLAWRFFNTNEYKNIIENKGDIIKLTTLGNTMLIHTQHSMFQFNADATLQLSENADKVNIANVDIWNLQYKEVYTSKLGFGGLQKLEHAIQGQFGYVFYDADGKRFFRYDGGKLKQIDTNINNYIRNLPKDTNVNLALDEYRNRILINFNNKNFNNWLSYNYLYDIFVSKHDNLCNIGYNTKNNLYLITDNDNIKLYKFDNNNYNDYKFSTTSEASILFNIDYERIKFIEYITYKINKILNIDNPNNYTVDNYYSGDKIQIYNNECNTKLLDIYIENPKETINRTKDYTKPYRDLGVWNFSPLRNDIKGYINFNNYSNTMTRIYGDYFIVRFVFNNETVNNNCIELENIHVELNNSNS